MKCFTDLFKQLCFCCVTDGTKEPTFSTPKAPAPTLSSRPISKFRQNLSGIDTGSRGAERKVRTRLATLLNTPATPFNTDVVTRTAVPKTPPAPASVHAAPTDSVAARPVLHASSNDQAATAAPSPRAEASLSSAGINRPRRTLPKDARIDAGTSTTKSGKPPVVPIHRPVHDAGKASLDARRKATRDRIMQNKNAAEKAATQRSTLPPPWERVAYSPTQKPFIAGGGRNARSDQQVGGAKSRTGSGSTPQVPAGTRSEHTGSKRRYGGDAR